MCMLEGMAVSQGHVDSPHKDSTREKHQRFDPLYMFSVCIWDLILVMSGCLLRECLMVLCCEFVCACMDA